MTFSAIPLVATALLDRLRHHAVVVQTEGASYRLRYHADPMPGHTPVRMPTSPPPAETPRSATQIGGSYHLIG